MNKINQYLETVCEQIRFQKAHDSIKRELQDHINDQIDALMQEGIEEQQAVELAVKEMGDPVLVGTELDRVHRPSIKWGFFVAVVLLCFANFALRFTMMYADSTYHYPTLFNIRNILGFLIAIVVMILFYHIDFTILAHHSKIIYGIYVLIMAGVCFWTNTYSGGNDGGACYFIVSDNFSMVVPPLIYLFPILLIGLLYDCRGKSYGAIFLCGASFVPPAFFSMGLRIDIAVLLVAWISLILLLLTAIKGWFSVPKSHAILFICGMTVLVCVILACNPMIQNQFDFLFFRMPMSMALFQENVKTASLCGMGQDIFMPYSGDEPYNFSYLVFIDGAEYYTAFGLRYFGWIPFLIVFALYFFFVGKGFLLAKKQKSQLGSMTAFAILLTFSALALWNIATNSGFFIYINPLQMPFFAAGGTSNVIFSIMMGILLSVFRTGNYAKDTSFSIQQQNKFFSWHDGTLTLTIHFKKRKKGEDSLE